MKKHLLHIIYLLVFLFQGNTIYSQSWVSLDGTEKGKDLTINVIKSDTSIHKVKMTVHGFHDNKMTIDGKEYHNIYMDEGAGLQDVGEPQLPTITQSIAIPDGASYKISITEEKWKDIKVGTIFPAQKSSRDNEPIPPFTIADSIYRQDFYSPFIVSNGWEQNWRNIRNVSFAICPFKYYPQENKLSVLSEFVLQVDFIGTSDKSSIRQEEIQSAIKWQMYNNDIKKFPVKSLMSKSASSSNDYDYLIIVGDTPSILNSQALQDFRKWKAFKGYKTKVVSTTTIGTTSDTIKTYITNEFLNNNIKYVLLIGDNDKIPLYFKSYYDFTYGDYYYGCITGGDYDFNAEIPVGRFSTNSLSDFQNMVNKTIAYERSFNGNYQASLLVAHKGNNGHYQSCCNGIYDAYHSYLNFTKDYGGNGATNSNVVSHINIGKHVVNYRGHGDYYCWGAEGEEWNTSNQIFNQTEISGIQTNSIYFNICCKTGNIKYMNDPCFMETFTRSQKGAIACLASTGDLHTYMASYYNNRLYKKLINNNVWNIGNLNTSAHIEAIESYSFESESRKLAIINALLILCGGDPTLEIWTGTPNNYSNVSISKSGSSMTVSSPSFSSSDMIAVVSEAGELLAKYSVSGSSCTFSVPSGNFYFAVNRHNYYPYVTYCSTSGYIQNKTIDVNSYYDATPMNVGYDVTSLQSYGNVKVKSGSKLTIKKGSGGVTIKNGFECEQGAEMVIE